MKKDARAALLFKTIFDNLYVKIRVRLINAMLINFNGIREVPNMRINNDSIHVIPVCQLYM